MDHIIAPFASRVDSRNHRRAQYTLTERELDTRSNPYEQEADHIDKPLLIREHKRRTAMTNSHRRFHRRAPQAGTNVKTVNVEVVATVDTAGNVVAQTTVTQPESIPTEASQVLPTTNATDVSVPSATPEPATPTAATTVAAAAAAASTLEVPSIASLPSETQAGAPSAPSEPSQASAPSASAEPTMATVVAVPSVPSVPSVPAVPAVPSVSLPSVPPVPPFPSDLTVPAYPFASSSIEAVAADAVAASSSASSAAASSEPSIVAALTAASTTNSTISSISSSPSSIASSILASSPTLLSSMGGFTHSSLSAVAASQTAISSGISLSGSSQSGSSPSTTGSSDRATPTESLDAAGSSSFYGSGGPGWIGGGGAATAASPAGTNAAAAGESGNGGTTPIDTTQVVGSVVGSLAGAALILAIILMLLRRHKRRQGGALQLTDSRPADNEQAMRQVQAPPPVRASLVPSAFLNRFSGLSRSTADTSSPTERSFQRVSGRKLPSAFSEGMTSDQVARGGHMSDASFYQDDHGTYGGPGLNKEYGGLALNKEYGGGFGKEIGETSFAGGAATMNIRPSPARTPIIRHPSENPFDDTNRSTLSPPMSPNPFSSPNPDLPPRAALGRSLHSADGSRSSRFTENV